MGLEIKQKEKDPKTIILSWEGDAFKEVSKPLFYNDLRKISASTREDFLKALAPLEAKIGKRYAIYLLSKRGYLSSDLLDKLQSKGICKETAQTIVDFCSEKGFLNDSEMMHRLIAKESRKTQSAKGIFFKLKAKKGIDQNLLREKITEASISEKDVLQKWVMKNSRRIDFNDPQEVRKVAAKLCRKGFSYEEVSRALKQEL